MDSCCWKHTAIPTPGSEEALKVHCTCATMDNGNGKGFPWPREDGRDPKEHPSYWITETCPLHSLTFGLTTGRTQARKPNE